MTAESFANVRSKVVSMSYLGGQAAVEANQTFLQNRKRLQDPLTTKHVDRLKNEKQTKVISEWRKVIDRRRARGVSKCLLRPLSCTDTLRVP